jgi:pimeloyl-ACP methyl ester carboxylesterase
MALPALVLVHGGGLAADSWHLTVNGIQRLCPKLTVLAVDLPGRRGNPRDLETLTMADWVQSVVRDIDAAGMNDVVIFPRRKTGSRLLGEPLAFGAVI